MSLLKSCDADKCVLLQLGNILHTLHHVVIGVKRKGGGVDSVEDRERGERKTENERMPRGLVFNLPTNPNQCHYSFPLHFICS